jgi:3-keto-5-aminohexanoate cleavage enzyme
VEDLIICVAPCPGEKQAERFPGDLDTVEEVVASVAAGAAIAHLHARDRQQLQTTDPRRLVHDVETIKSRVDVIVEASTGGAPEHTLAERCASFAVPGIELGTLNLGSINMYDSVYQNPASDIEHYACELQARSIKPINVIFDLSHASALDRVLNEFPQPAPPIVGFVFDVPHTLPYQRRYLDLLRSEVPPGAPWFLTRYHARGAAAFHDALEDGGHVRVGFEDGPFLSTGRRATSNAALVTDIVDAARVLGRPIASAARARELLGLDPKASGDAERNTNRLG